MPLSTLLRGVLCVFVIQLTGTALVAAPVVGEPAVQSRKAALLVFVSYQGHGPSQLAASEARLSGSRLISAELRADGRCVLTYPELEPIMRHWRIRSDRDLSFEFLNALVAEYSVDHVLVSKLLAYHDRLLLLTRQLDPQSGMLLSADVAEEALFPDSWVDRVSTLSDWERAVEQACRKLPCLSTSPRSESRRTRLVLLPTVPVGVGTGPTDVVTHSLLRAVIETRAWSLPDPFLAVNTLRREGHDPGLLEAKGRRLLATQFGTDALLIPQVISFDLQQREIADRFADGDGAGRVSSEPDTRLPIYLALRKVDCTSGNVVAGNAELLEPESQQGLFGIAKSVRLARRLQKGASRLVRSLAADGGRS
jgi:hypothetical protein